MEDDPAYKALLGRLEKEHQITISEFLGKGSYSHVMKGLCNKKSNIAVKIIDTRSSTLITSEYSSQNIAMVEIY
ncbi:unnamed protein product [Haemonchus placei]|uniref:Protein kinase domain-containing protein n=1 Tax=Haemonchus placei TaxID=6290 RepID=A0A0N4WFM5_HAEPC|nr:unnamed protein product [Haemonchus placei]